MKPTVESITKAATTGREAWNALAQAGLLPSELVRAAVSQKIAREWLGKGGSAHAPDRVRDAAVIAKNAKKILSAEKLALKLVSSLPEIRVESITWKIGTSKRPDQSILVITKPRFEKILEKTLRFPASRSWQQEMDRWNAAEKALPRANNPFSIAKDLAASGVYVFSVDADDDGGSVVLELRI